MGTSAIATGFTDLHVKFERDFAELVGKPSACLFPTGYTANLGTVAGLLGSNDVIVMDQLCHASIVDGARLCGAKIRTFRHNDPTDLKSVLEAEASPYRTLLVVLEGVYSMGEGAAPIVDIVRMAKAYGALVLVDEAHSFGFYGPRGAGICAAQGVTEQVDFIMTTLSKALGSLGGVVAAREEHVALLRSSSRAFIFQASVSPADIAAAVTALRRLSTDDTLRERLWDTTAYMRRRFTEAGYNLGTGDGPIVTPHFPDKDKLFAIVNGMYRRGVCTSAVTYPIVSYLQETLTRSTVLTPSLAISVTLADSATATTIAIRERDVTLATAQPADLPFCRLHLVDAQAISALRSSDVQGLLGSILAGGCVLSGQVEPFVWLVGRMADRQQAAAPFAASPSGTKSRSSSTPTRTRLKSAPSRQRTSAAIGMPDWSRCIGSWPGARHRSRQRQRAGGTARTPRWAAELLRSPSSVADAAFPIALLAVRRAVERGHRDDHAARAGVISRLSSPW